MLNDLVTTRSAVVGSGPYKRPGRMLEGAAKHLIDGSEKRIYRLSFEF